MERITNSLKNTARLAGLLYLVMGVTAAYGIIYVPTRIITRGDAAATLENLLAHEFLFRTGIISHLVSQTVFLFLALTLYRLFRKVDGFAAKAMIALVIVQVPIGFIMESFNITSLMIAKGEVLSAFDPVKAQDWAMVFLSLNRHAVVPLEILWGLWLIPLGQLVYKSDFMPRILGVLLMIGGAAYILDSLTFLLLPSYRTFVSRPAMAAFAIAEISTILWLLIKGVKEQQQINEL